MPTVNSLIVCVSLAVPEHTHNGFCPNKGRHATWHMSYSQHSQESHKDTQTARWILALSLKSYIPHLTHDSQGAQQKNNVHHFHIIIGYAHSEHNNLCNGVTHKRQGVTTQFTFHRQMNRQTATSADYVKVSRLHLSAWKRSDFPES